jgi:superfamily II DNA/RNA helicase
MNLRTVTVFGGVPQSRQVAALREGPDVIIATPGRLEDLISQGHCRLQDVTITVLDEADHMADLGFLPAVTRILDQTPAGGQRLMFSATLDRGVDALVARYLHEPVVHSVDPVESSSEALEHHVFSVQQGHKSAVVTDLASGRGRTLLFTRTKHGAKKLARQLTTAGIPAAELHGNLSQSLRQRNLAAFTDGTVRVLVATDIAARGIHVDDINLVVHVDPPTEHKTFLHRSGRTARAGATGTVVTLVTPDQAKDVRTLVRQAGIRPVQAVVVPRDPQTTALTGPAAERRATVAVPSQPAAPRPNGARPSARDRRRGPHSRLEPTPHAGRPASGARRSTGGATAAAKPPSGRGGPAGRRRTR